MNSKILLYCFLALCLLFSEVEAQNQEQSSGLQIYLPREVIVQNSTLLLGQIGISTGESSLVNQSNQISLGRFSLPGQEIVIPRQTILSRLASNGISTSDVTFKGAESITVKQKQQIISGDDFVLLADNFLTKNIIDASVSGWKPIRTAPELIIPDVSEQIKFSYGLNNQGRQVSVTVTVFSGDEKIGSRNLVFRLEYRSRTAVALVDIAPGTMISSENVKIENRTASEPEPYGWKPPFGLLAKRLIPANATIRDDMVGSAKPETIIKRNQNVIIKVIQPGFTITASGKTMQDGKAGDFIKVRNIDSQRIIIVKVNEDGSVAPI